MHIGRSGQAIAIALGILLLALACRWFPFRFEIIGDEVFSANMASLPPGELLDVIGTHDAHPPGYYLLLGLVGEARGLDWRIRLPSLLFGLLLIAVAYGIGRAMGSPWLGVWFAALVAAGLIFSKQAGMARNYALHCLLASSAWLALICALRRGGTRWWALLAVLFALNCWTFYYAAHAIAALTAFFLLARPTRRQIRAYGLALLYAALACLPLLRILRDQMNVASAQTGVVHSAGWNIEWLVDELLGGHVVEIGPWGGKGYVPVALAIGLVLWFAVLRRRVGHIPAAEPERSAAVRWLVPTLGAALVFLAAVLLTVELVPQASARHACFLAVIWCVFAGLLVARLPRHCAAALLLSLVVGGAVHTILRTRRAQPAGFEAAAHRVVSEAEPGDEVLCMHASGKPVHDWYARGRGPRAWTTHLEVPRPWRWHTPSWGMAGRRPDRPPIGGATRIWVLWSALHIEGPDAERRLRTFLTAGGLRSAREWAWEHVRLELFTR